MRSRLKPFLFTATFVLFSSIAHAGPPKIYSDDGKYLGDASANQYDANSVSNPYGKYGSSYEKDSVNNPYGRYGSPYSKDSVNNPYADSYMNRKGKRDD